jgi:antitoxin (DNA-binding transcriptional repressor) of toxin-antitoxin stability system
VRRVKIADLKNNLSRHLLHVRKGGELLVFDRDRPVARVVPYVPPSRTASPSGPDDYWSADRLAELERQGTLIRGDGLDARWIAEHRPRKLPPGAPSAVELLLAMRRESTR